MCLCVACPRLQVSVPLNILDQGGYSVSTLMQLQPGGVMGCATCPDRHVLLAASGDGTISAIDYRCGSCDHGCHNLCRPEKQYSHILLSSLFSRHAKGSR